MSSTNHCPHLCPFLWTFYSLKEIRSHDRHSPTSRSIRSVPVQKRPPYLLRTCQTLFPGVVTLLRLHDAKYLRWIMLPIGALSLFCVSYLTADLCPQTYLQCLEVAYSFANSAVQLFLQYWAFPRWTCFHRLCSHAWYFCFSRQMVIVGLTLGLY